jgi:cytochrome c oxidase subunit 2
MAAETSAPATGAAQRDPRHGIWIFIAWLVISVPADLLIWFVLGPHLPPGNEASAAGGQQFDIKVMSVMAAPVMAFVIVYFLYSLIFWRQKDGDEEDGPPIQGNLTIQVSWITVTTVIVLCLFGFGTYELVNTAGAGAGSGQGPVPITNPAGAELTVAQQQAPYSAGKPLVVQVIAQQWRFTYRYPQFGGFETTYLAVPQGQWVEFDVTSLDVIHSFWAYQLGVKADANPGVNNIAYSKPLQVGSITVRCAELCGLWHGAMYDYGRVMTQPNFVTWAKHSETHFADVTSLLPAYDTTYDPTAIAQLGSVYGKLGITGANGSYYPPQDPSQP